MGDPRLRHDFVALKRQHRDVSPITLIFRELRSTAADPAIRAQCTSLILVARSLERVADHATNICEEVFYLVEAADIRHQT